MRDEISDIPSGKRIWELTQEALATARYAFDFEREARYLKDLAPNEQPFFRALIGPDYTRWKEYQAEKEHDTYITLQDIKTERDAERFMFQQSPISWHERVQWEMTRQDRDIEIER